MCYTFFKEEYTKQILLDNKLVDKSDNVNNLFEKIKAGFAAIKIVEGDKSYRKYIKFIKIF